MIIKDTNCNQYVLVDRKGKPLTPDEVHFLELINKIQDEYGSGVILAIKTILEAVIKK